MTANDTGKYENEGFENENFREGRISYKEAVSKDRAKVYRVCMAALDAHFLAW
jgi:hypothetical protein